MRYTVPSAGQRVLRDSLRNSARSAAGRGSRASKDVSVDTRAAAERFLASPSLSDGTRRAYRFDVDEFCRWLEQRDTPLDAIDVRTIVEYASFLGTARGGRGRLAPATTARKLAAVRAFLRHALGAARVPDARVTPRRGRRLPDVPRPIELERELAALEGDGPIALRNRTLIEVVYSAGLRSAEAVGLDLADVDFEQELVHVRSGKGGKDRIVPLGEEAALWTARYLRDARPQLARGANAARSSCRLPADASTRARFGAWRRIRTACGTPSRRTCSRAAPTSGRSRNCSATARSRRRRCTATSTPAACVRSTTAHTPARRSCVRPSVSYTG